MTLARKWGRPYDVPLIVLAFGLVALYVLPAGWGFPYDDSWIHQAYGRNLGFYGEWSLIRGIPSAASTSPLYTVLLALGYALRADYMLWTHGLSTLALAGCGLLAARLGERVETGWRYTGVATGAATILTWHLLFAAASGMETVLFCMFTLALIFIAWRELDTRSPRVRDTLLRGAIFGVITALATSTRPEGIVLAGLLGLAMLIARPDGSWRTAMTWCVSAATAFLVCIAPYLLLNLHLTGGLLPDTSAAKQAEFAYILEQNSVLQIFLNFFGQIIVGSQLLFLPGMLFYVARYSKRFIGDRRAALFLVPAAWIIALIAIYTLRLPTWIQYGRYAVPALPALMVMGVTGTILLLARVNQQRRINRVAVRFATAMLLIFHICCGLLIGSQLLLKSVATINQEMVTAAFWIRDNLPPENGLLATHDIGAVAYFAPRPLLDTAGLITPDAAAFFEDPEGMWALMQERGAVYFLALPDQVPGQKRNDPHLCEIYSTDGPILSKLSWNMKLYRLNWGEGCQQ